jgi:hypothetical protein
MSRAKSIHTARLLVGLCLTAISCSDRRSLDSTPVERPELRPTTNTKALASHKVTRDHESPNRDYDHPPPGLDILGRNASKRTVPEPREGEYSMVTIPGGFVQRNAYFSSAELSNPAQEQGFRNHHPVRCEGGETYTRREVRWYEPTITGGERCAAVIHVAVCRGQQLQDSITERVRADLVALEPEKIVPQHCGPDPIGARKEESPLQQEQHQIVTTAAGGKCDISNLDPNERLKVYNTTRFGVRTFIDTTLAADRSIIAENDFLRRAPESVLGPAAYNAGERQPQFMRNGLVLQKGTNIAIEQRVTKSGRGYCISLTAIQGRRVWRRGFDRPLALSPVAAQAGWRSAPPILRDAHALARSLREAFITKPFSMNDR